MYRNLIFKRHLSDSLRKDLLLDCLNDRFSTVLESLRKIPPSEMDASILQTILSRGCHFGHTSTVCHIWYKYVIREKTLVVSPPLLCEIGTLALNEGKHFLPGQLYYHFKKFFSHELTHVSGQNTEYELLRLKVESFAKGTIRSTSFREKWKVFLEDIDHHFSSGFKLSVWDYMYLTKSLVDTDNDRLMRMLFTEDQIRIENNSTLPLLLNMILLQPLHSTENKINLFKRFHRFYPTLDYDDTLTILLRKCELDKDAYRMTVILEYVRENNMAPLSPHATRIFRRGIQHLGYSSMPNQYSLSLSDIK